MDISFITSMYIPVIMAACLIVGFIVKKWIKDIDNKWIPTIVTVLGAILAVAMDKGISIDVIIAGAASGLASTGLHQLFKQLIEGGGHDSDGTAE